MLLQLTQEERGRLERLNKDRATIESLKKLFLNCYIKKASINEGVLAAERIAIDLLQDAFKELSHIKPDNTEPVERENLV